MVHVVDHLFDESATKVNRILDEYASFPKIYQEKVDRYLDACRNYSAAHAIAYADETISPFAVRKAFDIMKREASVMNKIEYFMIDIKVRKESWDKVKEMRPSHSQ